MRGVKTDNFPLAFVAAFVLGLAQMLLLVYCWNYIVIYSPLLHWLISLGVRDVTLHALVFATDSVVNIALCLPAAFVLCQLRPRRLLVYLMAAVIPAFIWQYRLVLQDPFAIQQLWQFIPGVVSALLMLPIATFFVTRISKPSRA